VHHHHVGALAVNAKHVDRRQANQQLANVPRVNLQRGSPDRSASGTVRLSEPCAAPVDPPYALTPRSDPTRRIAAGSRVAG
jgi:hypothetical protein